MKIIFLPREILSRSKDPISWIMVTFKKYVRKLPRPPSPACCICVKMSKKTEEVAQCSKIGKILQYGIAG